MRLVANSLNREYIFNIVQQIDRERLTRIDLAVAYATKMDAIFTLARETGVPLTLYTLADGNGFPGLRVARTFIVGDRVAWRLFLTRAYFHSKIMWFRGVGAYIGSANLTDDAWYRNLECGVWIPQDELEERNWIPQLSAMFAALHDRFREATSHDLEALAQLAESRRRLTAAEREFAEVRDRILAHLPGNQSPNVRDRPTDGGGAARARFIDEWNQGIAILQKITRLFAENRDRWPDWVDQGAHPAIVQDQATEWWWQTDFRSTRESRRLMLEAHESNRRDPDRAVRDLLDRWCRFDGGNDGQWHPYINDYPRELHQLLLPDSLEQLDEHGLARIVFLCHSSREHARQIPNRTFGLPADAQHTVEERCAFYANFLWRQRSGAGRRVVDVLRYVLWGDQQGRASNQDSASRIWAAASHDDWRLPHLGVHILGELVGYARPGEFPPRNNRVSKTLYALGFDNISYY